MQVTHKCAADAHSFHVGQDSIEQVEKYKYLGLEINHKMNWKDTQLNIHQRTNKAICKLQSQLKQCDVPPSLLLKLYDKLILSISMYGSEIWVNHAKIDPKCLAPTLEKYES